VTVSFYCIFDQINAALVSMRLSKTKQKTVPTLSSVYVCRYL